MTGKGEIGAPFSLVAPQPELVVESVGDFAGDEGAVVSIRGDIVVFQAKFNGVELILGVEITQLLDAIQTYGHKYGH